eukprot:m.180319 g.180319  ORF g.180319 m.180319 type:complete len:697 (-) comp13574_c0_seq3:286-2376(-)
MNNNNNKDFVPTPEELQAIEKALKDKEFCKLLAEYAEEISDPQNKKKHEEELRQMEAMQGNDVTFINPEPGFVLKSKLEGKSGMKVFVNICQSDVIEKPVSTRAKENGQVGVKWSLPHSIATHRDDVDKKGGKCIVYDAVFHPDALRLAKKDQRFKEIVVATAIDGISQRFPQHKLDKTNPKFPKMKFKGVPARSVIRKKKDGTKPPEKEDVQKKIKETLEDDLRIVAEKTIVSKDTNTNNDEEEANQSTPATTTVTKSETSCSSTTTSTTSTNSSAAVVPVHKVVYRRDFDLSSMRNAPDARDSERPTSVAVTVKLPMCATAAEVDVEIEERLVVLECTEKNVYLEIKLDYSVNEEKGSAKFDKATRVLTISLPIVPPSPEELKTQRAMLSKFVGEVNQADKQEVAITASECETQEREDQDLRDHTKKGEQKRIHEPLTKTDSHVSNNNEQHSTTPSSNDGIEVQAVSTPTTVTISKILQTVEWVSIVVNTSLPIQREEVDVSLHTTNIASIVIHGLDVSIGTTLMIFRFDACVDEQSITVDINNKNIVIAAKKSPTMIWQRVRYSSAKDSKLIEFLFPTADNAKKEIAQLEDKWEEGKESQHSTSKTLKASIEIKQNVGGEEKKERNEVVDGDGKDCIEMITQQTKDNKVEEKEEMKPVKQEFNLTRNYKDKKPTSIQTPSEPNILSHDLMFDL